MNTLLIYPPWRQPFMPPLSLAALTGFLEAQGVACRQREIPDLMERPQKGRWKRRDRRTTVWGSVWCG